MSRVIRVLSIDGGGIRGLIPALVLAHLERLSSRPAHTLFDLIAGTSTGAILAAGLAKPDPIAAKDLADLYIGKGSRIFSTSPFRAFAAPFAGPLYDAAPLEGILADRFGAALLGDCLTSVLIPCYDIQARSAHFFKSWRAAGHMTPLGETAAAVNFAIRDVVRAATAAPTYFAPARIMSQAGTALHAIDGAIFANNPSMCALAETRVLHPDATGILLVSLGVGEFRLPIDYDEARTWGQLSWARAAIESAMDGAADTVDYQLRESFAQDVRYHRLQIGLNGPDGASDAIDDASSRNIGKLIARAQKLIDQNDGLLARLAAALASQSKNPGGVLA